MPIVVWYILLAAVGQPLAAYKDFDATESMNEQTVEPVWFTTPQMIFFASPAIGGIQLTPYGSLT